MPTASQPKLYGLVSAIQLWFTTDIKGFRCLPLHAVGQLERLDPRLERRVVRASRRMMLVQLANQVQLLPLLFRLNSPLRIFSISFSISVCLVSMYVP